MESGAQGIPRFLISPELALLVFLKRLRTRGSVLVQLQGFFGRSTGWISSVFNAVVAFIAKEWIPRKVQRLDTRVFNKWRLRDYADRLYQQGLRIPNVCGFVDGTFHSICRPGCDGYKGLLQQVFYSDAKKGHGLRKTAMRDRTRD